MATRQMRKRVRKGGLTAYKLVELLTGKIRYPVLGYDGYGDPTSSLRGDDLAEHFISDEMRADWEAHRDQLTAFWRSGEYTTTKNLEPFGLNVRMPPWLFACGSARALPWAAQQFDKTTEQKNGR